jgi:hypothetical protein
MASARSSVVVTVTVWPLALDKPASSALRRMEFPAFFSVGSTATMAVSCACAMPPASALIHKAPHTRRWMVPGCMVFPFEVVAGGACCAAVREATQSMVGFC